MLVQLMTIVSFLVANELLAKTLIEKNKDVYILNAVILNDIGSDRMLYVRRKYQLFSGATTDFSLTYSGSNNKNIPLH